MAVAFQRPAAHRHLIWKSFGKRKFSVLEFWRHDKGFPKPFEAVRNVSVLPFFFLLVVFRKGLNLPITQVRSFLTHYRDHNRQKAESSWKIILIMRIIISRSLYNEIQKNLLRVSECLLPVWMRHRFCYSSALYFVKGTYFSFHEDEPGEKTGWYFVSNSYEKK